MRWVGWLILIAVIGLTAAEAAWGQNSAQTGGSYQVQPQRPGSTRVLPRPGYTPLRVYPTNAGSGSLGPQSLNSRGRYSNSPYRSSAGARPSSSWSALHSARTNSAEPQALLFTPRSRFSRLPYGMRDYYQFQNLVRVSEPFSLNNQIALHYGSSMTGTSPKTPAVPALGQSLASRTLNPGAFVRSQDFRTYFDSRITGANQPAELVRVDTGKRITGPVNDRLLQSYLFTAVQLQAAKEGGGREGPVGMLVVPPEKSMLLGKPGAGQGQEQKDQGGLYRPLTAPRKGETPKPAVGGPEKPAAAALPSGSMGNLQESGEVFERMLRRRERMEQAAGPEAVVIKSPSGELGAQPVEPLKTFVGAAQSERNKGLQEAEELMRAGQYYKAAGMYDLVRVADPHNPLPLLGRAMALLAAGEYMTSMNNLCSAIELFEHLAYYQVDLGAFVPDLRVLDRRRAELEQRLESYEDFRLRFLLGYAEYCSGLEGPGLADMDKAVQSVPPELDSVHRFVAILQQRHARASAPAPRRHAPPTPGFSSRRGGS